MHTHARIGAAILLAAACQTAALAQQSQDRTPSNLLQQQRLIDDKLADQRLQETPLEEAVDWQWGGWIEYYVFLFDDGVQSSRLFHRPAMALWTRIVADNGAHELFVRGKLAYEYYNPGDEYDRQRDWVGPNLERGWYRIDVGKAFRLTEPSDPFQLNVKVGRQETIWGTGFVFDQPIDAVTLNVKLHDFRLEGLIGKSFSSTPNIDFSEPVDTHSNRCFLGFQATYEGFENHQPFVYAIWNDDSTDERPTDWFQNYSYDTQYFGVGSRGQLARNFHYWAEAAFEAGKSFGDRTVLGRDDVNAWGGDVGLEYLFDGDSKPRVAFEYMFASGDGDRAGSPVSAAGGNRRGRDTSFNAFGYRDTGLSAAPELSNMHVWRLGGSLQPFTSVEPLREFELGTNFFLYQKNQSGGAISDVTADIASGYVGWEMDYYINWRIASDLSWTTRWGVFFPGDAYSERGSRHFVFTGVTWSF